MSHFAKIHNSKVIEVIVAEQDFVDTLPGTWIQTSYNARAGLHYDSSGNVTGPGLRMNYACVGDTYDAEADAFYGPRPSPMSYLDKKTWTWTTAISNKYPKSVLTKRTKGRNRIFVDPRSTRIVSSQVWLSLQASLGVDFVDTLDQAQYSLPMTDMQTYELVKGGICAPMSPTSLHNITDRIGMQSLGIPVVRSVLPRSAEDLRQTFDSTVPVFVKRRKTYGKDKSVLSYTSWKNVEQFIAAVDSEFWPSQNNPQDTFGEFVVQHLLPHPLESLNLHVAVNKYGEAFVWAKMLRTHDSVNVLGRYVPYKGKCVEVLKEICRVCTEQRIGPSMHELEFVWLDNKWTLLDWNPRLTGHFIHSLAAVYPVMDDALLHMMGEDIRGEAQDLYTEQRTYARNLFDDSVNSCAVRWGLYSCIDNLQTIRLSSVGETSAEVQSRFAAFEKYLNTRNT